MNFAAAYERHRTVPEGPRFVALPDAGVRTFRAELYTEHRQILADIPSPERRLSDHLNSSAPTLDVRLLYLARDNWASVPDLTSTQARLTKARVLMAIPVDDLDRPVEPADPFWVSGVEHPCRVGIGPYDVSATMHVESGRDPLVALSQNPREFVPLTRVTVNFVDGRSICYRAVLMNRSHIDVLIIEQ